MYSFLCVVSRNMNFLKSILFCIQINLYYGIFFASRLRGFTNEFMFMSPQCHLAEMTGFSPLLLGQK